MMKLLVSVGTTPFDPLIKKVDELSVFFGDCFFYAQTSKLSGYTPKHIEHSEFISDFNSFVLGFDIVITHAGAGNIYSLLELGKTLIVVPNLARIDKHQSDISLYVESNDYGEVCWELDNLKFSIENSFSKSFRAYKKESFFGVKAIFSTLGIDFFKGI